MAKLTSKLTELPKPARCDEMSLIVDCLRAFTLLLGPDSPIGVKVKAAARKNQSKLKEPEKLLLTSLRAIFNAFDAVGELSLANGHDYTPSEDVMDATRFLIQLNN